MRNVTIEDVLFGTSMPTIGRPGTGASIRKLGAANARAKSLCNAVIRLTRTRVRETSTSSLSAFPSESVSTFPLSSRKTTDFVFTAQPGSTPN